ncbi:RNA polymerase Rpb1 C-terminal repeat-containing, putative [Babesia ovis]|uniref:RNA polymerase Rpb1 C-terminal repeat-containing, putative n=1 Tax=Babesia ovis TaxID=5869 RepID=A0A9W5WUS0_BABOV|nr:RNA polymerase Rpb1 C-terminal repeat-containing, putative [Babesia ovis]
MELQSLEFLASNIGGLALYTVSSFLDLCDFLNLSATSHSMRRVMLSHSAIWRSYYESRVATYTTNSCHTTSKLQTEFLNGNSEEDSSCSYISSISASHQGGMPGPGDTVPWHKGCEQTYNGHVTSVKEHWFESLIALARFGGVSLRDPPIYNNPFVEFALQSAAASRRRKVDREIVKDLLLVTTPIVAAPDAECGNGAPFTLISKTRLFHFDAQYKFCETRISLPYPDETNIYVLSATWVRYAPCRRCATAGPKSVPASDPPSAYTHEVPPRLALLYRKERYETAVSVYAYDTDGFKKRPIITRKVHGTSGDITCLDATQGLFCDHYILTMGYSNGNISEIHTDYEESFDVSPEAIVNLMHVGSQPDRLLCVHLANGNIVILRYNKSWERCRLIASVSSLAINTKTSVIGHCSNSRCKVTFGTLMGPEVEIGVSKPPSRVLCLYRNSLWAIVIRNYLKLVEVTSYSDTISVRHVRALNGHAAEITTCHSDGWSRIISVDSSQTLILWDFVQGVKLLSIPLLRTIEPGRLPRTYQEKVPEMKSRKRPSVNRQVSYASIHNVKKDFNAPPKMMGIVTTDTSDSDSDIGSSMGRLHLRSRLAPENRHSIQLLPSALCIYYHNSSVFQLLSFK